MSKATHRYAHAAMTAVFWLAGLASAGWSARAEAACPGDDPCETIKIYRLQSSPTIRVDAAGRPLISIQEANGADLGAFTVIVAGQVESKALAIRYSVTRIANAPNDYCECNLEFDGRGCHSGMPVQDQLLCTRNCRRGADLGGRDVVCTATGFNFKQQSGGKWYSFPAATQCVGARNVWKKNAFGAPKPTHCDWLENSRVIKPAACIAIAMAARPGVDVDALFDDDNICPAIKEEDVDYLN